MQINRYRLDEISRIRLRRADSSMTVEIDAGSLLNGSDFPEFRENDVFYDIRDFQKALTRLKEHKDIIVEFDFPEAT